MKNLFLMLVISVSQLNFAQADKVKIQKDFESIVEFTQKKQFDKVIDMTYPRFVKIFGKEGLSALTNGMFEAMGAKAIFEEKSLNLKMSTIPKLKDGSSICMGQYDSSMILEFNDEKMVSLFKMGSSPEMRVEVIDSKKVRLSGKAYLLAINDSYTNNTWKYLNYTPELAKSPEATEVVTKEIITESEKLKNSFGK
jgi:hypothetical protein